ncbi:hypothetical protein [uncultured Modestobacter sp.]|uniref:hypothetical protein n=1 Tax=uncultured Modestobacter sp. TaxID=380048 RepID=UPI002613AD09|nr:hypothetical protein [uncultured Modestobacter sp.]
MHLRVVQRRDNSVPRPGRARRRVPALAATALAGALLAAALPTGVATAAPRPAAGQQQPDLGPNVHVFDPSMPSAEIEATVDAIAARQVDNHFGPERYALLFMPGTYGSAADPLDIEVGYGTEVAGLGAAPSDVVVNGHVEVYNRCYPTAPGAPSDCTALNNFWRSLSNLTINITDLDRGCRAGTNFWAASQASPMRRVDVTGGQLSLMDYCTDGPQYASGGYIADSRAGTVVNGSQQQYLIRDSTIGSWSNGVWNQVFSGVEGAPAQSFPDPPYTTLPTTPVSREKPYLYVDDRGAWQVFVPAQQTDSAGTTWADGATEGRSIPLSDFVIARPGDRIGQINGALARGQHLLLTPGVYDVDQTIKVKRADTVVLGLGLATLTAQRGAVPMEVSDVPGVTIAGLMIDAGPVNSPALLRVGSRPGSDRGYASGNDTALMDVFFRIGGPHVGKASVSLEVDSDHVLLDHIWAWRADHGEGVGWTVNTADTGVVVNGDDVTALGLFVEHYQRYQTIWNGERGRTVLYQNEMPYDPPNQAAWQHDGVLGWAAYKVADHVREHEAWGLGSYIYTNVDPTIHATTAFEVPVTPGVRLHDLLTVSLNNAGTIDSVVNGVGAPARAEQSGVASTVVSYP